MFSKEGKAEKNRTMSIKLSTTMCKLSIPLSSDLFNFLNYSKITKKAIIITVISSYSYKTNIKEK